MKSKFLNFLTISAILLPSFTTLSGAFAMSLNPHNKSTEDLDPFWAQNHPAFLKPDKPAEGCKVSSVSGKQSAPLVSASHSQQAHFSHQLYREGENTLKGVAGLMLFIAYVVGGIRYRRTRLLQAIALQQQIALLERIWQKSP